MANTSAYPGVPYTMWSVARRPRWIAALIFALVLAAGFAALSQWQLARSVQNGTPIVRQTEHTAQLAAIAKPQSPVTDKLDGQLVAASGHWVAGDYMLVADRLNNGTQGWWVIGHFSANTSAANTSAANTSTANTSAADNAAGLAVALGWSPTAARAKAALAGLSAAPPSTENVTISGRYNVSDSPSDSDYKHDRLTTVSSAELLNAWKTSDPDGIYGGYLTMTHPAAGLTAIYSPPPVSNVQVDLLNVFYAVEWVVFAAFAIFLWYRLVRDAWEREREEALEQAATPQPAEVN